MRQGSIYRVVVPSVGILIDTGQRGRMSMNPCLVGLLIPRSQVRFLYGPPAIYPGIMRIIRGVLQASTALASRASTVCLLGFARSTFPAGKTNDLPVPFDERPVSPDKSRVHVPRYQVGVGVKRHRRGGVA